MITLFWVSSPAMLMGLGYVDGLIGLFVGCTLLVLSVFRFKARAAEVQKI